MMMRDVLVGDDRDRCARREPRHMRARFADETGADQDVVAALSEIDPEPFHNGGLSVDEPMLFPSAGQQRRNRKTPLDWREYLRRRQSCGPSREITAMSACA